MSKLLYLDCSMGIAGDMLMGALLELAADREEALRKVNELRIPDVIVEAQPSVKCGITGTHMRVKIRGMEEGSQDVKMEPHHHHHSTLEHINHIIEHIVTPEGVESSMMEKVKKDVKAIYQIIAGAESKVHGRTVAEVHFHEVGMMDAIADITACALLIHTLGIDQIIASPVNVGYGQVSCAHGILPVPAPATANILMGIPCYAGNVEGELCTPTGAALLKYFADSFSQMPLMTMERIGYGMGTKDFDRANCVRAVLGVRSDKEDKIIELNCNIDDMTAEETAYATELLLTSGALDVFTTAVGMKKSRPGILLTVICKETEKEKMARIIFRHTSTIGIRELECNRMVLNRTEEEIDTEFGKIRLKRSFGYGVVKEKLEYEDLKAAAGKAGISIQEVKQKIQNKKGE